MPYAYSSTEWVGYDDIESLKEKVILNLGLNLCFGEIKIFIKRCVSLN